MPDYSSDLFALQTTILTLIGPFLETILKPPKAPSPDKGPRPIQSKRSPFVFNFFKVQPTKPDETKELTLLIFFGTVRLFCNVSQSMLQNFDEKFEMCNIK